MRKAPHKRAWASGWAAVRRILCEWDPLGVMSGPSSPIDEYDCMVGPILGLLSRGASVDELRACLEFQLTEHFGLTSSGEASAQEISAKLKNWFSQVEC